MSEAVKSYLSYIHLSFACPRLSYLSRSKHLSVQQLCPPKKMELERETPNSSGGSPGGLREYKVVMLGAGGVGKSGEFVFHTGF